ncbi:hypothetical protein CSW64_14125 [Caulobacter mirabilis]|uniref:Uncharacterized protein n=2 Tax=Caulobacter mirabilis TaxID=69666 RepID=A0A2D2B435_9CAUL|nr:hypothetical protein CSW64_14125 [Caulobacter mirabilis]
MVAVAAWARISRATPPLDADAARGLLAAEFPDDVFEAPWIAADGGGAVARSGDRALVVYRLGDSWVARSLAWDAALAAPQRGGKVHMRLDDIAAPTAKLAVTGVNPWPPLAEAA